MDKADYHQSIYQFSLNKSGKSWSLRVNTQEDSNTWTAALRAVRRKVIDENFNGWLKLHRPNNHHNLDARRRYRKKLIDTESLTPKISLISASFAMEAVHQGNLWKMGANIRSWSKRFCELHNDQTILYWDESDNGERPNTKHRGCIDIWGVLCIKQLSSNETD